MNDDSKEYNRLERWLQPALGALLAALAAVLLVGHALGFPFAGAERTADPRPVRLAVLEGTARIDRAGAVRDARAGESLRRGEILRTDEDSRALLRIDGTTVAISSRTDLRLDALAPGDLRVTLLRGRLMADADERLRLLTEPARTNTLVPDGGLSLVHFDFREAVAVLPISASAATVIEERTVHEGDTPYEYHRLPEPGVIQSEEPFDPSGSSEAEFYAWFETVTDFRFPEPRD